MGVELVILARQRSTTSVLVVVVVVVGGEGIFAVVREEPRGLSCLELLAGRFVLSAVCVLVVFACVVNARVKCKVNVVRIVING